MSTKRSALGGAEGLPGRHPEAARPRAAALRSDRAEIDVLHHHRRRLVAVLQVVGGIMATLQASRGEPARYPFCVNLVR